MFKPEFLVCVQRKNTRNVGCQVNSTLHMYNMYQDIDFHEIPMQVCTPSTLIKIKSLPLPENIRRTRFRCPPHVLEHSGLWLS